jgi:hypothetical protein
MTQKFTVSFNAIIAFLKKLPFVIKIEYQKSFIIYILSINSLLLLFK